jgi:hypothetical protein
MAAEQLMKGHSTSIPAVTCNIGVPHYTRQQRAATMLPMPAIAADYSSGMTALLLSSLPSVCSVPQQPYWLLLQSEPQNLQAA